MVVLLLLKEIARQGNIPIYAANTLQASLVLTSAFINYKRSQNCCLPLPQDFGASSAASIFLCVLQRHLLARPAGVEPATGGLRVLGDAL